MTKQKSRLEFTRATTSRKTDKINYENEYWKKKKRWRNNRIEFIVFSEYLQWLSKSRAKWILTEGQAGILLWFWKTTLGVRWKTGVMFNNSSEEQKWKGTWIYDLAPQFFNVFVKLQHYLSYYRAGGLSIWRLYLLHYTY